MENTLTALTLIEYTFFLSNYSKYTHDASRSNTSSKVCMKHIMELLPLLTTQGQLVLADCQYLHLPNYLSGYFAPKEVSFWLTLNDDYLQWYKQSNISKLNPESLIDLQSFFERLGITSHLYIDNLTVSYDEQDYDSLELSLIIDTLTRLSEDNETTSQDEYINYAGDITKLIKVLSIQWTEYYDAFMRRCVYSSTTRTLQSETSSTLPSQIPSTSETLVSQSPSTLHSRIQQSNWLPSRQGIHTSTRSEIRRTNHRLSGSI